ncbi:tumor necrosis factor receptor superfamily member 14-like isoform X1 [Mixophyes fleayi]|uniref:tumor necrosis factor receptor superfamily member 14-like isoform X1 n=1 Tax=Mixophyes fleayi TaxID=3061075 RepID=UPI003F4DB3C4
MTAVTDSMEIWISAEMSFLIISLYLTILRTIVLCCNHEEYKINDICCPMCPAGTAVSRHCTANSRDIVCATCIEGTYRDHPNGFTECLLCKDCDPVAGLEEIRKCTHISDTICGCRAGYFCPEDYGAGCDLCKKHRKCEPGQYIKEFGTARTDTVCEDCPPGHFSSKSMSLTCTPWRECFSLEIAGSSISNSICRRRHDILCISVIYILVAMCAIFSTSWKKKAKEIKKPCNNGSSSSPPVQEQGTGSVTSATHINLSDNQQYRS